MTTTQPLFALAEGVTIPDEQADAEAVVVVGTPDGRLLRVGADIATLLRALGSRGRADVDGLTGDLDARWTLETVETTLTRLQHAGLVARAGDPVPSVRAGAADIRRRLEFRAPMAIQLTVWRPAAAPNLLLRLLAATTGRAGACSVVILAAAGAFPTVAALSNGSSRLSQPIGVSSYLAALVALVGTVSLHELAHAGALIRRGGRPRRIGVMLFYLAPAMFCDISDAWRLPRRARVEVALAGPAVHAGCAGLAGILATQVPHSASAPITLYAALNYSYLVVNLIPFVKLDGYLALMAWLDIPFLRRRAMAEFRSCCVAALFGAEPGPRLGPTWIPWFGAACCLTPFVLLGLAARRLVNTLVPAGPLGALLALSLLAVLLTLTVRGILGLVLDGYRRRRSGARGLAASAGVLAVLGCTLSWAPITTTASAGFVADKGAISLVVGRHTALRGLTAGDRMQLWQAGALRGSLLGNAILTGRHHACRVPLSALVPAVEYRGAGISAECYELAVSTSALTPSALTPSALTPSALTPSGVAVSGVAVSGVAVGPSRKAHSPTIPTWAYRTYLQPPLDAILGH